MNWVVFWQCFIAVLALSFIVLIFCAIASGASATRHKRKLEVIEATRVKITMIDGGLEVGGRDPKAVAEAARKIEQELNL